MGKENGELQPGSAEAPMQQREVSEPIPTTVFDRMAELELRLAEAQEAQAQLEQRRANDRKRVSRWREKNPEEARRQRRESMRRTRARRKQAGGTGEPQPGGTE